MKINFSLVHNNNKERNDLIKPSLKKLAEFISDNVDIDVNITETSYQPNFRQISQELTVARYQILAQVENEWLIYCGHKPVMKGIQPVTLEDQKKSVVEMMVTDKHIRAWDKFLDSNAELIICFEDDAIILEESFPKLLSVLEKATAYKALSNVNLYCDLAGGFPLNALGVEGLIEKQEKEFIFFTKPITNTACCYLMNQLMVANFKDFLLNIPPLRLMPIDWMINKLLIELDVHKLPSACFHTIPPVFSHGSATNVWKSWANSFL